MSENITEEIKPLNMIPENRNKTAKTLIVLGSGGHTAEMVEIVKSLDKTKYIPRFYVLAKSDKTSKDKITEIETMDGSYTFVNIYRSRNVKQSYITSIFTTIVAIIACFPILWRIRPELILCNGPGTCVPICLVGYIFKVLRIIPNCKIVFVESFCRVKTISLTGKILLKITDLFVIQWRPQINISNSKNIKYFGRLT